MENNKNEEGTKDLDRYEKIVEFARKEIDHVHSVYKWLAWILGIFIVIATYLTWDSIRDMKNSIRSEVDIVQGQVNRKIDEQFKPEKITSLMGDKALEYTKNTAQLYIKNEVNDVIVPFKKEIQNTTTEVKAQTQKLNSLYRVFYIAIHAKSGSKSAYLDLKQYAAKEGTEEAVMAKDNLKEIERDLLQYQTVHRQSPYVQ
jgi:hypothetical protein